MSFCPIVLNRYIDVKKITYKNGKPRNAKKDLTSLQDNKIIIFFVDNFVFVKHLSSKYFMKPRRKLERPISIDDVLNTYRL